MPLPNNPNPVSESVAIYTRVSTDNQIGGRFDSCESQAAYCREKITQQKANGWYEVACLTDAAYSGGTMDRPGIKILKRMIEAGEVKIVLIYKLERVLRSTDEWVPFRAFLKKHGCRLESATEDLSEATPSGRLKNNLMMSFSQYERENTAEKTQMKMHQQAKRGIWNGGYVPYGYSYDKNTQTLQPHPEEAPIVRQLFEQAALLVSLTAIANDLNARGLRTKVRPLRRRDGKVDSSGGRLFRSDHLRQIIQNPIYRGSVRFGGNEYGARHEALIAKDLWDKANAATSATKPRPQYLFHERDAQNHLLKGLAWCSSCGRALVPNDSGKKSASGVKYRYYTCSLVMRETAAAPCPVGRLSADALEKAVVTMIGEASKHPTMVAEMVVASQTMRRGDRDALRAETERFKGEIAAVEKKLGNCAEAVAKGGADALSEALVRRAAELRDERQRLLFDQERARQELALCNATVLEEKRIRENLGKLGQAIPQLPPQEQKELIRLFVERVEIRRHGIKPPKTTVGAAAGQSEQHVMEMRIKLHLPELVHGMQERGSAREGSSVSIRGLSLDGRIDFSHAQRGEISIIAPFQRTVRLDARVRTVPIPKPMPAMVHPIVRARQWQRLLDDKVVAHRFALASREGCTPGAVTKIMKLLKLAPEIQDHLATLKDRQDVWHFSIKRMGEISALPPELQRRAYAQIWKNYESRKQALPGASNQVALPVKPSTRPSHTRGMSA